MYKMVRFWITCCLISTLGLLTSVGRAQDSQQTKRDSIEIELLRTTQTFSQVIQLIRVLPAGSDYLALLPSVLPVDLPLERFRVVSPFGTRLHPILKKNRFHGGVDIRAATGTLVKATAAGFVTQVGFDPMLGAFVRLQHAFGFETVYGHLNGYCVKPGQRIELNEQIGRVGQTGMTTGPHLHYVLKKNGSAIDPFNFCFLLRHRLWLYQSASPTASGISDSTGESCASSSEK
jgi:murein DD-endopeptidase MepM/ murein hydrolase activator NlpD